MKIDFTKIQERCSETSCLIRKNKKVIINILTRYETYHVAEDEIERTLDLLDSLDENSDYFKGNNINSIAVFLPSNQPFYVFFCFAIIPSFLAKEVNVRMPQCMKSFFMDLMKQIELKKGFKNINIVGSNRENFLALITATRLDIRTNKRIPLTDVVIFTGKTESANKVKKLFCKEVLFILNGSGHNPVIVTETANINKAIESVLRLQLYNQGQDCAAPNSILVHKNAYDAFLKKIKEKLKKVKTGDYKNKKVLVGPITKIKNFKKIQEILVKNYKWIDPDTEAVVNFKTKIIKPIIILKSLKYGGNYTEHYAPILFIQKYNSEDELELYFENEKYRKNAMYITVFGDSNYLNNKKREDLNFLKNYGITISNTDLHAKGVERGVQEYGGYSKGASSLSLNGFTIPQPTLPQRDIYNIVIKKNMEKFYPTKKRGNQKIKKRKESIKDRKHWGSLYADSVLEKFPEKEEYVCAAGISPSGTIHFGNFRDVVTSYAVFKKLGKMGKKTKMIFSWDDFDKFRKVPQGVNPSFEKYIDMPLSAVPSPDGKEESYAKYQEKEFEKAMKDLGIEMEYRYQTNEYKFGKYDDYIVQALQNKDKIANILLSFMSEKGKSNKGIEDDRYKENYYPVSVYSRFSGKDNTRVIDYDGGSKITYKCFDTGKTETVDIRKDRIVKLSWKVDWAMRWAFENVSFEPGGSDHSSPGGSYDTSSVIAREIFDIEPPIFRGYDFVGIRGLGSKMSGSKGGSVSPRKLLEIYTPELLKWLYFKTEPNKRFSLAFDSEVYRQYVEFDKEIKKAKESRQKMNDFELSTLELSGILGKQLKWKTPIPFKQVVSFGQIVQWDREKLLEILKALGFDYDEDSLSERMEKAKAWLETYNRDEIIKLEEEKNTEYIKTLSENELGNARRLKKELEVDSHRTISELNSLVYGIVKRKDLDMKENAKRQKSFFKMVYNLLIGKNAGPRLSTFLWAIEDKNKILQLLDV